jgi:acid phosphatase (class A)
MTTRKTVFTVLAFAIAALGAVVPWRATIAPASAQSATPPPSSGAAPPGSNMTPRPTVAGYLGQQGSPDYRVFLPPPPAVGSARGNADVAIFRETRALANTARWKLAVNDDRIGQDALLGGFSCAAAVDLAGADVPATRRVITRAGADLFPLVSTSKDAFQRPRPFLNEPGPICITPSESLARQGSYPSGHAASAWLYALLLAEIDSEHADAIIERGRAFGESRVVCGVHYLSDIEAGRLVSTAVVAALHGKPEFEADVDAARAEIDALRASSGKKPAAAVCESEGALLATPW